MQEWIENMVGDTMNPIVAYIIIFLAIILAIYLIVRIARRLLGGTFVAGGKSRHLRLAVMDATPVDAHRRLVLVRRDDVEHLILIGGPTDLVVEQNIKLSVQSQPRQAPVSAPVASAIAERPENLSAPMPLRAVPPAPQPQQAPRPVAPEPVMPRPTQTYTPPPVRSVTPLPSPVRSVEPLPPTTAQPRPIAPAPAAAPAPSTSQLPISAVPVSTAPVALAAAATMATAATATAMPAPAVSKPVSSEDALLVDLSNDIEKAAGHDAEEISLEDEMEGLLASLDTKSERLS
jgi:hypothetical protein